MMHSSTIAGSIPARATASRTTKAPSSVAEKLLSPPRNFPVGVRTAETMTASCMYLIVRRVQKGPPYGIAALTRRPGPSGPGGMSKGRGLLGKLNLADRVITEQRREPLLDERHQSLDLLVPCGILGGHPQHAVAQIDCRSTIDGGPHRNTPGKRDFVACERHPAQDSFERRGHDVLNGNHAARIALPAKGFRTCGDRPWLVGSIFLARSARQDRYADSPHDSFLGGIAVDAIDTRICFTAEGGAAARRGHPVRCSARR